MLRAPDPTFSLLLATLRWPDDGRRRQTIARLAAARIDWTRFRALANRHRVAPLAFHGLAAAELAVPDWLHEQALEVPRRALFSEMAMAGEIERLQACLAGRGVRAIALKGPAVSLRAFGQLGLRTYRDLDLLVGEPDVETALKLLGEAGYALAEPGQPDALPAWQRHHKDAELRHRQTGLTLELHWRLFDNKALMPAAPVPVPLGIAPLAGSLVLPPAVELEYLCLHGALHGWSRLRWLADIAAILAANPEAAPGGRPRPALAQALILCRELLGAQLAPPAWRAASRSMRGTAMARLAWREILRSDTRELEESRLGSTVKNASHYALIDSLPGLVEELRFDLTAPRRKAVT